MSVQSIKQTIQNGAYKLTPFKSSNFSSVKKISWDKVKSLKTVPSSIVGASCRMRHCAMSHRYQRLVDHDAEIKTSFSSSRFKRTNHKHTEASVKKPKVVKQRVKISGKYDGNSHEYQSNRTAFLNKK